MAKQVLALLFAGMICATCFADEPSIKATTKPKHDNSETEILSGLVTDRDGNPIEGAPP